MGSKRRVVVTGVGALTPLGNNKHDYWKNLELGLSGSGPITKFDSSKFKTKFACEVKGFNPEDFIDRKESKKMDPFCQYAMVCAEEAVMDSGLNVDSEHINKKRIGVIWGSGIGGLRTFIDEVSAFAKGDGTPRFSPFFIPKMIIDIAAGLISMKYGFMGVNYATVSACATSGHSIGQAFRAIQNGDVDACLTGGSEAVVNEAAVGGFNAMRALSENNTNMETASRPYDATRDGFVLGEGAGALMLEELEHALKRGAKIYGEIIGYGASADAYHMVAPHPDGLGVLECMKSAMADAEISSNEVQYINTHGTSTPLGDGAELKAIKGIFGEKVYDINISSTKSMTGHLLGAAGAIEAIACIMAINKGVIPPTINHTTFDPEIDPKLNLTLNKAQYRDVNIALTNTFGFGGHNVSLIIKKFEA